MGIGTLGRLKKMSLIIIIELYIYKGRSKCVGHNLRWSSLRVRLTVIEHSRSTTRPVQPKAWQIWEPKIQHRDYVSQLR